jgi:hypothetical protein
MCHGRTEHKEAASRTRTAIWRDLGIDQPSNRVQTAINICPRAPVINTDLATER